MQITDPIADMLTRIRNANSAKHDTVSVPASVSVSADTGRTIPMFAQSDTVVSISDNFLNIIFPPFSAVFYGIIFYFLIYLRYMLLQITSHSPLLPFFTA